METTEEGKPEVEVPATFVNPLLMPEVLINVFKYFRPCELLFCRGVCHVWNTESSTFLHTRKIICIPNVQKLKDVLNLTLENGNHPFRTFVFQDVELNLNNSTIQEFFNVVGPLLHYLTFQYDKDGDVKLYARDFRDILLYHTPNLKSLILRQIPETVLTDSVFPVDCSHKFKQPLLPNLKSLTFFSDKDVSYKFCHSLLSATCNLEEVIVEFGDEPRNFKQILLNALSDCSPHLQNLTVLKYFMHDPGNDSGWAWTADECTTLINMKLPLKVLKFHPAGKNQQQSVFSVLDSHSKSLTVLKLRVHDPLYCPRMGELQRLTLYDYEGSLAFLDQLPALKYLGLCEYFPSKSVTSENIVSNTPHNLTTLNIYGSCSVSTHILKLIAKAFPLLRILSIWHVNNEKLTIIIQQFPLLEDLTMNVTDVTDSAITGIPSEICEQIERQGNCSEFIQQLDCIRTKPSLLDLKYLRRLELHGASLADWQWSPITDVSIILGIVYLPNLTSLSLYEFKWITEASLNAIKDSNLRLLYLKLDSRIFSEDAISLLKRQRPELRLEHVNDDFEGYNYGVTSGIGFSI